MGILSTDSHPLIFVLIFGRAIGVETGGVPYPIFALCGMSCWTYFSFLMGQSGSSIIAAQNMIKKIYFPRLIIPLSKAVVGFIDYLIIIALLAILMIYYQFLPSPNIIFAPIFILITIISALGVGIWLSALTVRYRDFQHVVPFLVQFGLYASPVAFPAELIIQRFPPWLSFLYYLNPMAGVIEGFRWSVIGGALPHHYSYLSFIMAFLLFSFGILYFKRMERVMADIV
ncbi:MAG: ABC transporter permease [Bacteroidetes bacterium]|nr:ABC transporter permease [Bacteroidota bacterium]MDA1121305.1 ABC transporter permease [Bacteroidota bacterium]